MSRFSLSFLLLSAPVALVSQSASSHTTHRLWVEFDIGRPHSSLGSGQANQMSMAGYNYTKADDTTCDTLDTICVTGAGTYYPQESGPSRGAGFAAGFDLTRQLTVSGGTAYTKLGGATGLRKDAITGNTFVRSFWDSHAYWLIPSWRPVPHLRIGAGPGYYSVRETKSNTQSNRFGLHAEAAGELDFAGPMFVSVAYKLDRAGKGTATNPNMTLSADLNYSALAVGLGVRLFK